MLLKEQVKEISTFEKHLDNTITTREFEGGCLNSYHLDYTETLVYLDGAITINLYQYQDIYLNKTNYYYIYNHTTDTAQLYKEI